MRDREPERKIEVSVVPVHSGCDGREIKKDQGREVNIPTNVSVAQVGFVGPIFRGRVPVD